ncbi:predicted protein [Sclerotinia sclerotiorum 1980 UF-70]|uniref:Uncharacterized protein n=1 Tax=Sclerotinia sclerotiorum (strain ATCC 18683 / 1980 / Ss-1) TaxID=665079 RepID=A7EKX6_SCLS1|nr:predicted protein [Sclerotinia sclerotiorum 1980 UF-70]EDO03492.1 predicted protein [Sclerotinia sclerotiorum 1980 UF-70]
MRKEGFNKRFPEFVVEYEGNILENDFDYNDSDSDDETIERYREYTTPVVNVD